MVKCINCMQNFNPTRSDQMFCSKRCRRIYYKKMYVNVPRCSNCCNINCKYKNTHKGKYSPKECPER